MRSFWRVLLVWLTALAIPVQGVAAAGMVHCLAANAPVPVDQRVGHERHGQHHPGHQRHQRGDQGSDQRGLHDHHAPAGADHAKPRGQPATTSAVVTIVSPADGAASQEFPAASAQAGHVPGADQKCSACAACCVAAALPPHVAGVPMLDLVSTPTSRIEVTSVSFIASGPERPPRLHLA